MRWLGAPGMTPFSTLTNTLMKSSCDFSDSRIFIYLRTLHGFQLLLFFFFLSREWIYWNSLKLQEGSTETWDYTVLCLVIQSCPTLCDPMDCSLPGSSVHLDSPGRNTGVGCHALLQGIFPTQRSNPGLPRCRQIIYWLSRLGNHVTILPGLIPGSPVGCL